MTDLRDVVEVRGPGLPAEFTIDAIVGSEVLDAVQLPEDLVLRKAAAAIEFEVGMAEIHTGSAAGLDHVVFPLGGTRAKGWLDLTLVKVWLDLMPEPQVVVWLA